MINYQKSNRQNALDYPGSTYYNVIRRIKTCQRQLRFAYQTTWKKILLVLLVVPITMLKNGIRIVTLSVLAVYVDRGFLESSLHRDGGIVFFILALCLLAPILFVLRKSENKREVTSDRWKKGTKRVTGDR